jgi:hypothetical protein
MESRVKALCSSFQYYEYNITPVSTLSWVDANENEEQQEVVGGVLNATDRDWWAYDSMIMQLWIGGGL